MRVRSSATFAVDGAQEREREQAHEKDEPGEYDRGPCLSLGNVHLVPPLFGQLAEEHLPDQPENIDGRNRRAHHAERPQYRIRLE